MRSEGAASTAKDSVERPRGRPALQPHLVRLLSSSDPFLPSARHALGAVDLVTIGRGPLGAERGRDHDARVLRLRDPNPRVSTAHARIRRVLGGWHLDDLGSKNGTHLDGAPVKTAALGDGALIEIGRTFYLFVAAAPLAADEPLDLQAADGPAAGMTTLNPAFGQELRALAAVARSGVSVVLHGETGTGKEVLARAVHELSARTGPFIAVNCGAIPDSLVETELFGVRRGAFSDAKEDRPGLIRAAHKGTLFLDEIGDLDLALQPAFLRVLQEREVVPVGATRGVPVDLRLVTASHRDVEKLAAGGQFRADLAARISGFTMRLPPLRARREDLGLLIAAVLRHLGGRPEAVSFHPDAMRLLLRHQWPRNVRELEKRLAAAVALAQGGPVEVTHLGDLAETVRTSARPTATDDPQRAELERLLAAHGGNLAAVARTLGKDRVQIRRWVKRHGLDPAAYKP